VTIVHLATGLASAAVLGTLLATASFAIANRAGGRTRVRVAALAASFIVIPTALFHALSVLALFRLPFVLGALALVALAAGPRRARREVERYARLWRLLRSRLRESRHRQVLLVVAVLLAPTLLRGLILPPMGWDSLTYHVFKAAEWLRTGGVDGMAGTGPFGCHRLMFGGGEVLSAFGFLPFGDDTLAGFLDGLLYLGAGLGTLLAARALRVKEPFASSAALFVLSVPVLRLMPGSGYVEGGIVAALFVGHALLSEARSRLPVLLGAATLGVAAGIKFPVLGMATAGLVVSLIELRIQRRLTLAASVLAFAAFASFVAPWMLRAARETGYPLSPIPIRAFGITLGVASPEVAWWIDHADLPAYRLSAEAHALQQVFGLPADVTAAQGVWPFALLLLAAAPRGARRCFSRPGGPALLVMGVVNLALYFSPGFSLVRLEWASSSARFLLPALVVLGITGLAAGRIREGRSERWRRLVVVLAIATLALTAHHGFSSGSIGWLVLLAVLGAPLQLLIHPCRKLVTLSVAIVAGVVLVIAAKEYYRHEAYAGEIVLHSFPRYWVSAAELVDDDSRPATIAVTSGPYQRLDNWFVAPFLGRRFQNRVLYVPSSADGALLRWGSAPAAESVVRAADAEGFYASLLRNGVTHVMSFIPPGPELAFLEGRPDRYARLDGRAGLWGLYAVERNGASP